MTNLLPVPTCQNNLSIFVGELRDLLFSSQGEAASYFCLNRSRISRYEDTAVKDKPKPGYIAELARLLAERNRNHPETQKALLREVNKNLRREYRRSPLNNWTSLCQTAAVYMDRQRVKCAKNPAPRQSLPSEKNNWQAELKNRLELPPLVSLIGVEKLVERLLKTLSVANAPWLISIEGLGGLGKTALANALIRHPLLGKRFAGLAWVSAKQRDFFSGMTFEKIKEVQQPALGVNALIDALLEQLNSDALLSQPLAHKKTALRRLFNQRPYLVVVDNLETVNDYQLLLPDLQKLANPGKIILTSRHSLRAHSDVFCLSLNEMSHPDAIHLIKQEAKTRGIEELATASESQLGEIIEVVGGNPLALKLVVGQTSRLPLFQVLKTLKRYPDAASDALYTYIYWQSWQLLSPAAQQLLLIMPLAQNSRFEHLQALSQLDSAALNEAIQELMELSLLRMGGSLQERRYNIHRLTETFLLNEAIKWKASL